jgi:hypothetical protein
LETQPESFAEEAPKFNDVRLAFLDIFPFPEIKNTRILGKDEKIEKVINTLKKNNISVEEASKYFKIAEDFILPLRIEDQYFRLRFANLELSFTKILNGESISSKCTCEVFLTIYPAIGAANLNAQH